MSDSNNNQTPDNFSGVLSVTLVRKELPALLIDKHSMFHLYEVMNEVVKSLGFRVEFITGACVDDATNQPVSYQLNETNLPEFWQACHDDHKDEAAYARKQLAHMKAIMAGIVKNDPAALPAFLTTLRQEHPELAAQIEGTAPRSNMPGVGFMAAGPKGDQ